MLDGVNTFAPRYLGFFSTDPDSQIQAALAGRAVVQASDLACKAYLASGELVNILPEIQQEKWQLYLYRPYQIPTPKRVLKVFELLTGLLQKYLG